jgi:hypothetical protein
VFKTSINSAQIVQHLQSQYPGLHHELEHPPGWIATLKQLETEDDGEGEWHRAARGGQTGQVDDSNFAYWRQGRDLDFLQSRTDSAPAVPHPSTNAFSALAESGPDFSDEESSDRYDEESSDSYAGESEGGDETEELWEQAYASHDVAHGATGLPVLADLDLHVEFFRARVLSTVPSIPDSDRPLKELLDREGGIWQMSRSERERLHQYWENEIRDIANLTQNEEFKRLQLLHNEAHRNYMESKDEVRSKVVRILRRILSLTL